MTSPNPTLPSARWLGAVAALLPGCAPEPPEYVPDCVTEGTEVEVAPPGGDFGDLAPGDPLFCGIPPQGGAPYTPLRFRATGPEVFGDGVSTHVVATDRATGEVLGDTSVALGVVCANAGDDAGWWTGAEVHLRYEGLTVAELDGRAAELRFEVAAEPSGAGSGAVTVDVSLACE